MVVDASAVFEWLLQTSLGRELEARMLAAGRALAAPHLLDLEIAQVLRRWVAAGSLSAPRAAEVLADFTALPLVRYPHTPLLPRVWELRRNLTAYDAAYLALAEGLNVPLLTCDRKLRGVPGVRAQVILARTG